MTRRCRPNCAIWARLRRSRRQSRAGQGRAGQVRGYLNDWPQRRVVAMHSSARVVGSLCQVAAIVLSCYLSLLQSNPMVFTPMLVKSRRVAVARPVVAGLAGASVNFCFLPGPALAPAPAATRPAATAAPSPTPAPSPLRPISAHPCSWTAPAARVPRAPSLAHRRPRSDTDPDPDSSSLSSSCPT
jgi:hypothetical protein